MRSKPPKKHEPVIKILIVISLLVFTLGLFATIIGNQLIHNKVTGLLEPDKLPGYFTHLVGATGLVFLFGLVVILLLGICLGLFTKDVGINIKGIISEKSDKESDKIGVASLSRFQFLIFTIIFALTIFLVILGAKDGPKFPKTIPNYVFILLGISSGTYVLSKWIGGGQSEEINHDPERPGNDNNDLLVPNSLDASNYETIIKSIENENMKTFLKDCYPESQKTKGLFELEKNITTNEKEILKRVLDLSKKET